MVSVHFPIASPAPSGGSISVKPKNNKPPITAIKLNFVNCFLSIFESSLYESKKQIERMDIFVETMRKMSSLDARELAINIVLGFELKQRYAKSVAAKSRKPYFISI